MMKGFFRVCVFNCSLIILGYHLACFNIRAQQNNTLFFMHSLPEANYLNPAVQIDCGYFIGLPVISSSHVNLANSGFAARDLITVYRDGSSEVKTDMQVSDFPGKRYFISELHTVLLATGFRRNDLYYSFSMTEKNNLVAVYTPDLVAFSLRGSEQFEGQQVQMKGTSLAFNHLREYAFGVSKDLKNGWIVGIKIKLLFGKYNVFTRNSRFGLSVEPGTRDLLLDVNGGLKSSLPVGLQEIAPEVYRFEDIYDAPVLNQLMNGRNPGIAFDFGFIYRYNEDWTFSGSLLDVGGLWYRSNISNYTVEGNDTYNGPFGNGRVHDEYLYDVFDNLNANMTESLTTGSYIYMLDPRMYLGASGRFNDRFDVNFLLYNRLLPRKLQTGGTVSLLTNRDRAVRGSISWSYMNNSFANLGLGLIGGRRPVQFYAVTDNVFGLIFPLHARNVNLRFGFNLILGCREGGNDSMDNCGCGWIKAAADKRARIERSKTRKWKYAE